MQIAKKTILQRSTRNACDFFFLTSKQCWKGKLSKGMLCSCDVFQWTSLISPTFKPCFSAFPLCLLHTFFFIRMVIHIINGVCSIFNNFLIERGKTNGYIMLPLVKNFIGRTKGQASSSEHVTKNGYCLMIKKISAD